MTKTDLRSGESLRSWQAGDADPGLAAEVNGETITILVDQPFDMEDDYWENQPMLENGYEDT